MLVFVLLYISCCPFWFFNYLGEEGGAGCLPFIIFLMSCYCKCPVALSHSGVGWSAVCGCGIS